MARLTSILIYFQVLATLWSLPAGADDRVKEAETLRIPIFRIISMMGRMGWDLKKPYYGSAIQFSFDTKSTYFVAAFHTLPRDRANWTRLSLTVPGGDKAGSTLTLPAQVVGIWPDYEVAVLKVSLGSFADGMDIKEEQKFLDEQFVTEDIADKDWRVAVVGTADAESKPLPSLTRFLWREEAAMLAKAVEPNVQAQDNNSLIRQWRASDSVIHLTNSEDCQPSEIESCFHVQLRTLGYSGGAFLVAPPKDATAVKIAGLVWGYRPLERDTIILPWQMVKEKAQKLLKAYLLGGSKEMIEIRGSTGKHFFYRGPNEVEILKSPEQRMIAKSGKFGSLAMSGGGESSGGGGESSGGGGESSGGGGESSGGGGPSAKTFVDQMHNSAIAVDLAAVSKEVANPKSWHKSQQNLDAIAHSIEPFRGVRALLSYVPGVEIDGEHFFQFDEKPIVNLSSFLQAYRKNPDGKLESEPKRLIFPKKLWTKAGNNFDQYGIFTQSSIHMLRLPLPAGIKLYPHELEAIAAAKELKDGGVMIYRQDLHSITSSASSGGIDIETNHFTIVLDCPRLKELGSGQVKYVSDGPLVSSGDYFKRFAGKLTYSSPINYPLAKGKGLQTSVNAVVSVQYSPADKRYELKVYAMGALPPTWDEVDNFYPDVKSFSKLFDPSQAKLLQSAFMPLYEVNTSGKD